MHYEIYTKVNISYTSENHTIALFDTFTDMSLCLKALIDAYGDNLYVRAISDIGRNALGTLAKRAKFIDPTKTAIGH